MNKLILTIGICGSGKSTWAQNYKSENKVYALSSDRLREVIGGNESDQDCSARVFDVMRIITEYNLKYGQNIEVIIDATNYRPKNRKEFIKYINA